MMKRFFGAVALVCALGVALAGGAHAQNTTTFGNIVSMGVPCGAANCVYYQLPPATAWVNITVAGTWTGTLEVAATSAPNANYSNLDTVAWTVLATESVNGTWSASTSGTVYLRVRATSWSGGTARVDMASSAVGSPQFAPLFQGPVAGTSTPGGTNAQIQYNASGVLAGSQATVDSGGNISTPASVTAKQAVASFVQSVSCTGARDGVDQGAVQAGINYIATHAPNGRGTLRIPEGQTCYIYMPAGSAATEALLITSPVSLGNSAQFYFDVPAAMNWVRIAPVAAPGYYPGSEDNFFNMVWRDVTLTGATAPGTGAATGLNGVVFDCTNNALGKILFDNVTINPVSFGGYSVDMNNTTNANGCVYISTFAHNYFSNGMYLFGFGDTNVIEYNKITNPSGDGINLYSISGAVDNIIRGNNIITGGNPIHIRAARHLQVENNETGIHNYGTTPPGPTAPATATIWLDGTAGFLTSDVSIRGNHVGTDENNTLAAPNLQIDAQVNQTNVGINFWVPQTVGGVPAPAVVNNGSQTCLVGNQNIVNFPNVTFWSGNGSNCKDNYASLSGLGNIVENQLLWSEDLTNAAWTTLTTGAGSVTAPVIVSGITLPDGTTGSATRIRLSAAAGGDLAGIQQAIGGLANPHSSVAQVYIKNATCPSSTVYTLHFGSLANSGAISSDCTGEPQLNGWRRATISLPSVEASTSDTWLLEIVGGSIYSSSVDVLVWGAQSSTNASDYVKTTDAPVTLTYGSSPRLNAGAQSPLGFQDISIAVRPSCTVAHRGQVYVEKATGASGADQPLVCNQLTSSPQAFGWQKLMAQAQQPENELLQSNTWNVSPWTLTATGVGVTPVVSVNGSTDPFGNTGTVQEVQLSLGGGSTSGDASRVLQIVSGRPNPHTSVISLWAKANSGTPTVGLFNSTTGITAGGNVVMHLTSSWQFFTFSTTASSTTDGWEMELIGGSIYSNTADVLVYGAQLSFNGGSYKVTTTTAIDLTPYVPLAAGFTLASAPLQPVTSVQGNASKVQMAGTVAGTAALLCTDANGNATTSGCPAVAASAPSILCRFSVAVPNTGSTTIADLFSCTIPAGTLGLNGTLKYVFYGGNPTGNTGSCTYTANLNTTTTPNTGQNLTSTAASTATRSVELRGMVSGANSTSSVAAEGSWVTNSNLAGTGGINNGTPFSINTAATMFLNFAVTNSVSADTCYGEQGLVELWP